MNNIGEDILHFKYSIIRERNGANNAHQKEKKGAIWLPIDTDDRKLKIFIHF